MKSGPGESLHSLPAPPPSLSFSRFHFSVFPLFTSSCSHCLAVPSEFCSHQRIFYLNIYLIFHAQRAATRSQSTDRRWNMPALYTAIAVSLYLYLIICANIWTDVKRGRSHEQRAQKKRKENSMSNSIKNWKINYKRKFETSKKAECVRLWKTR